jgi:hypothetical protein
MTIHESRLDLPVEVEFEEVVHRSGDGSGLLFRLPYGDGRRTSPWSLQRRPGADQIDLPVPEGISPEDTQLMLCEDASCAVMLYREPEGTHPRRTGIWVPRVPDERSEFRNDLERFGPFAAQGERHWIFEVTHQDVDLVAAIDGGAWLATPVTGLLFVGPTGHVRGRAGSAGPRQLWAVRGLRNWAAASYDTRSRVTGLTWQFVGRTATYAPDQGVVFDASFGEGYLAVSLTLPGGGGKVELLAAGTGEVLGTFDTQAPRRLQLVGQTLLLVDGEEGVDVHRVDDIHGYPAAEFPLQPVVTRVPSRPSPLEAPSPDELRRRHAYDSGPRRPRRQPGGVPWPLFAFLGAVAYISWRASPWRITIDTAATRTVTPSRPEGAPEVVDTPDEVGGIEFLVSDDFPPEATEILATFLYVRAASELRAQGSLPAELFEELRGRARERVLPLWEEVFPGAAPAVHAWIASRLQLLDDHLEPDAREALHARIQGAAEGAAENAPEGRLAQLYKLHLFFVAASEVAGGAAKLPEMLGHVFSQATAVLRELQEDRALPPGFAAAVRDQAQETVGALAPDGVLPPEEVARLDRLFEEAIATFLEVEEPTCRVCGDPLGKLPVATCTACDTPHHQDCWDFNQGCAVFACGGDTAATLAS